jgi:hypothetical protein
MKKKENSRRASGKGLTRGAVACPRGGAPRRADATRFPLFGKFRENGIG